MNSMVIGPEPVEAVLKRRGFAIEARGNTRDILLPLEIGPPLSGEKINEFRQLFGRSSFRKLIRRITSGGGNASVEQLDEIAGPQTDKYIEFLLGLGVAERIDERVTLTRTINNIGPTLEWYVADVCKKDFEGSAEWSVKLSDFRDGDFDVVAWLPPSLVYIETKSSRPSDVSISEVKHFLQRGQELAPDLAILLIDTEDDLNKCGFLERIFELMLPAVKLSSGIDDPKWRHDNDPFIAPQPSYPGIAFGFRRFYVTNSDPSIYRQLSRCLRHYHSEVKGAAFWGGQTVNFVTGELGEGN